MHKQIVCVLLQQQWDRAGRPNGSWSHSLKEAENPYNTAQCKWMVVVWVRLMLQSYLKGCLFTVCPDNDALKWIWYLMDSTGKLMCGQLGLFKLETDVVHRLEIIQPWTPITVCKYIYRYRHDAQLNDMSDMNVLSMH